MKLVSILVLLAALFTTSVFAEGNMGNGGRSTNGTTIKTQTVKSGSGMTTEDGDPPPACVPSETVTCDGNMGNGGRSASIFSIITDYLVSFFA